MIAWEQEQESISWHFKDTLFLLLFCVGVIDRIDGLLLTTEQELYRWTKGTPRRRQAEAFRYAGTCNF